VDAPSEPPPYVYAATDIRPRQAREIELCDQAARFDWMYTGGFLAGIVGSVFLDIKIFKLDERPGIRFFGPGLVGFTWGGFLSGGYLSLPKCDRQWVYGAPPEGDVSAAWPMATVITLLAGVTAPLIEATFLGAPKVDWFDWERATRVFVAGGAGVAGALLPYVLSPRPWAARKELDRIRVGATAGGAALTYRIAF
jgi:hypothetical protein